MKKYVLVFLLLFLLTSCGTTEITCNDDETIENGECIKVEVPCEGIIIDDECILLDESELALYQALENTITSEYYSLKVTLTENTQTVLLESYYEDGVSVHSINNGSEILITRVQEDICYVNDIESSMDQCITGNKYLFYKDISPGHFTYSGDTYIFNSQYKTDFNQVLSNEINNDSFEVFIITINEQHINTLTITLLYGETRIKCDIEFIYYEESQLEEEEAIS